MHQPCRCAREPHHNGCLVVSMASTAEAFTLGHGAGEYSGAPATDAREGCSVAAWLRIWSAHRALRTSPWGMAQEVAALNQAMDAHEGCNVAGWLDVQRVAGNFHISVHAEDFLMLTKVSKHLPAGQDQCIWTRWRLLAQLARRKHSWCRAQAQALRVQGSWSLRLLRGGQGMPLQCPVSVATKLFAVGADAGVHRGGAAKAAGQDGEG